MEIAVGVVLVVTGYFVNDYLKNIFPDSLKKMAWKRISSLDLKEVTKELIFQGFISDCECQKSSTREYILMIKFILTIQNIEIPPKTEKKER